MTKSLHQHVASLSTLKLLREGIAHVFILSIRWIVILRSIVVMSPLIPVYSWSKIVEAAVIWFSDVVVFIHCFIIVTSLLCLLGYY